MAGHEATCARSQITCSSGTQRNKMLRSQQHGTSRHSKTLAAHRSEHNKYSLLNVTAQLSQDITLKDTDLLLYESLRFCQSPFFIASNSCYCSYKVAVCANKEWPSSSLSELHRTLFCSASSAYCTKYPACLWNPRTLRSTYALPPPQRKRGRGRRRWSEIAAVRFLMQVLAP